MDLNFSIEAWLLPPITGLSISSMFKLSSAYTRLCFKTGLCRHAFRVNGATFARTDFRGTLKTQRVAPRPCVFQLHLQAPSDTTPTLPGSQARVGGAWQGACAPHTRTCVRTLDRLDRLADFYWISIHFMSCNPGGWANILTGGPQWVWKGATGEKLIWWALSKTLISLWLLN